MRHRSQAAWVAGLLATAAPAPAQNAQSAPAALNDPTPQMNAAPPPQRLGTYAMALRSHSGVPDDAIRFIAGIGIPSRLPVQSGEDAQAHLATKCGYHRTALDNELRRLNPTLTSDLKVAQVGDLLLPACARFEENVNLTLAQATSVAVLLRRETGFEGPHTLQGFWAANPKIRDSATPNEIPAGTELTLPYRARWTTVQLDPAAGMTGDQAVNRLRRILARTTTRANAESIRAAKSGPGYLISTVPKGQLATGGSGCAPPAASPWPIDVPALIAALDRTTKLARNAKRQIVEARVAVLDSAFVEPPAEPFSWSRIATTYGGVEGTADYYGVNGVDQKTAPLLLSDMEDADHGTMVATLVLGGTGFLAADTTNLSKVRVRTSSIIDVPADQGTGERLPGRVWETAVLYALADAKKQQASIVNMSFAFGTPLALLEQELRSSTGMLVVAAAGNQPQDIASIPRYPASYGGGVGDIMSRVVTVGASDGRSIADYSAHSAQKVDVIAPGCDVPTLGLNLKPVSVTGTSFAAPIVAFVAGLVRQFGVSDPALLKYRLLVSTDVDSKLLPFAWSGGRINPAKAVSLYEDRLELRDAATPRFGTVDWSITDEWTCSDSAFKIHDMRTIWKIARLNSGQPDDWLVFWRLASGEMLRCRANLSGETLDFIGEDGVPQTLPLGRVQDLIPRFYK